MTTRPLPPPNHYFHSTIELGNEGLELGPIVTEVYLPTEIVINRPMVVTPKVARIYEAQKVASPHPEAFWWDGRWLPYSELAGRPGFKGTADFAQGYIAEVWENDGDDGHTHYRMYGHRLVALSPDSFALSPDFSAFNASSDGRLPRFMRSAAALDPNNELPIVWRAKAFYG